MLKISLIALICISTFGCKKKAGSSVESLDNLAGTNLVQNTCSDANRSTENSLIPPQRIIFRNDVRASLSQQDKDAYSTEVDRYFSALPSSMQDVFLRLNGQVFLTPDASSICGQMFSDQNSDQYVANEARQKIESCFVFTGQQQASNIAAIQNAVRTGAQLPQVDKEYFVIVHQIYPNESGESRFRSIRHGGVRVFGFIYSQLLARLGQKTFSNGVSALNFDPMRDSLRGYKVNLALSFMRDLSISSNKNYDAKNIDFLLGSRQTQALMSQITMKTTPADFDRLLDTLSYQQISDTQPFNKSVRKERFLDFVFGEAFDSRGCSNDTRTVLHRDFPESEKVINQAFVYLTGDFSAKLLTALPPVPLKSASKAGSSSLALGEAYPQGYYPTSYLNQSYVPQYPGQPYPPPGYPGYAMPSYPGYQPVGYPQQNVSPLLLAFSNPAIQQQFTGLLSNLSSLGGAAGKSGSNSAGGGNGGRIADTLDSGGCPGGCCGAGGTCSGGCSSCSGGGCSGGCCGGSCSG